MVRRAASVPETANSGRREPKRLASSLSSIWEYSVEGGNLPRAVAVVGGKRTDTDCLACATVNWYLVTCEVAVAAAAVVVVGAAVDADAVAAGVGPTEEEVVTLAMDVMREAVDEILLPIATVAVADDSIGTPVLEMSSIPAAKDAFRPLGQDSLFRDGRNIRKEAYQDDRPEVMLCFRASEAASCCCCCCCPGCPDSE